MMKLLSANRILLAVVILFSFFGAEQLQAQRRIVVNVASVAPENTPYGDALNRMAGEWNRITNGEVQLRIYHNGTQGQEEDMYRKLKMNDIQGAVFTSFGLNLITPEILTLSCPFLIRNEAELEYVLANIRPDLIARIEEKGFHCMAWAAVGWIKIFSRYPVFVPDDLKRQKMASEPSETRLIQAFRTMGYQIVPLSLNELVTGLNSGMIDAAYNSPISAAGFQLFGIAKNMATINIAPFLGAIVLNQQAWRRIPAQYREQLERVNRQIEQRLASSVLQLEEETMQAMIRYGLVVNQLSPEQELPWYDDVVRAMPQLLSSGTFDSNTLNRINALLRDYRNREQ